ncbi:MAG: recombinase family protein [Planctomycetota bacterium]
MRGAHLPTAHLPKAARYRRVSDPSEKIENQDADTLRKAQELGLEILPEHDYKDIGSAWTTRPRLPERDRLLRDAAAGRLKGCTLIVWALDRIARTEELLPLVKTLRAAGVRLVSCKEPWADTEGPMGDLMIFLAGWFADMESRRKSERVKAARARVKAEGGRWGRRPLLLDETVLRDFRARGWGVRRIARALRVSVGTVHDRLKKLGLLSETGTASA